VRKFLSDTNRASRSGRSEDEAAAVGSGVRSQAIAGRGKVSSVGSVRVG
jgi:hypothetical protein